MWRDGCSTMMRRTGLSGCGKDSRMSICLGVAVMSLSCRSNISGYAAKASVLCCWLHTSTNVATWGGGRGLLWRLSLVSGWVLMGLWVRGGLTCGSSTAGSCAVLSFSHWISSSADAVSVCTGGCRVGSCMAAASPCRLSIGFWRSSYWRPDIVLRFMVPVTLACVGAPVGVASS